ncbi:MAG: cytochrome c [candidate division NC10 bacterium]|nr:cytochrome c [candidate division NC10 bacterium]
MKTPGWVLGILLLSGFLTAAGGTAELVEERRALMRVLAENLQAIWDGLAHGERDAVHGGAEQIAGLATRILTLFPPNSFHPPSRAQPAIREEFRTFETFTQNLKEAAEALAASARHETLADVKPHLTRLVQSCRQCHRSYVQPY